MGRPAHARWPLLALVGVALTLGAGHVCARLAFAHGVGILTAATARSVCAALVLLVLLRLRGIAILPLEGSAKAAVLFGVLIAVQTLGLQLAVKLLPVALAILLFYTYPLLTGFTTSLLGHRVSVRLMAALLVAFAGLSLVLGVAWHGIDAWGVVAALTASAFFTAVLVLTPRLTPTLAAPLRTFLMMSTAATLLLVVSVASQQLQWPHDRVGAAGLAGLTLLYAIGITTLFLVLPLLGPVQTAVVLNLEPVTVALIAWAALGEALSTVQMLGAATVVAAVIYFQIAARRA